MVSIAHHSDPPPKCTPYKWANHMNIEWIAHHLPRSLWFGTGKQVRWLSHNFFIIFKWWAFLYINNTLAWWAIDVKMKILHYISFLKQWAYCVICTWFAYHNPSKNDEQITQISCEFWRQNGCYREYMKNGPQKVLHFVSSWISIHVPRDAPCQILNCLV